MHKLLFFTACTVVQSTACTVVQAVVKANSQSNGKGQNWPLLVLDPCLKLGIYNRDAGMPTYANPCGAATTWVVWANTWIIHMLWFLRCTFFNFFALFFGSRRARTSGPILTIYTSYDVFPPMDVPFRVWFIPLPILGVKSPKNPILGAWIGIFKLNVQNIKIWILSKFLHRLPPNFAQSQRPPSTLRGWSQHA